MPGWSPQIGSVGTRQISELINKISQDDDNSKKIEDNQENDRRQKNQSFSDYQYLDQKFHKEFPKSRGSLVYFIVIL